MIVHIPHSSTRFPDGFPRGYIALSEKELQKELERMTDHKTDILFAHENAIVFPYSRLYCDVERLPNDDMEEIGMGICYRRTSTGKELYSRHHSEETRKALYSLHHTHFSEKVAADVKNNGKCLIIDAHSFPAVPLPYEKDLNRPDICIGTNEWDEGVKGIAEYTEQYFSEKGYRVLRNSPFWGSIVPEKYKYDKNVSSMMIEVNRGLYMEGDFDKVYGDIQQLLDELERLVV